MNGPVASWRQSVRSSDLAPTTKLVLLVVSSHTGVAPHFPDVNTLAQECSLNPQTVRRQITKLQKMGWLERIERYDESGGQLPNMYALTVPGGGGGTEDTPPPPSHVPQIHSVHTQKGGEGVSRVHPPLDRHVIRSINNTIQGGYTEDTPPPTKSTHRESQEKNFFSEQPDLLKVNEVEFPKPGDLRQNGSGYKYPTEFERFWESYPSRAGSNPKKAAYRKWRTTITSGNATVERLQEAVEGYAAHVEAEDKAGSHYVLMARTWLGPDEHWDQDWDTIVQDETHWASEL